MEQSGTAEYNENEAGIHALGGLAEDVVDAVVEYQVSPISPPLSFAYVAHSGNLVGKVSCPMEGVWWTLDDVAQELVAVLKYYHVDVPISDRFAALTCYPATDDEP